jgi:hypothetical protein
MMDSFDGIRVIEYRDEVIVEVQGTDEHGEIDVISYQFAYEDKDRSISPKGSVEDDHETIVNETLVEEGFHWQRGPTDSESH